MMTEPLSFAATTSRGGRATKPRPAQPVTRLPCKSKPMGGTKPRLTNKQAVAARWTYLCDQLRKSADGLYAMCEQKFDRPATKEVVLLSRNITRDFENLLLYFDEQAKWDTAKASNVNIAISWEMRKIVASNDKSQTVGPPGSPSKMTIKTHTDDGWKVVPSRKRRQHHRENQRVPATDSISSTTSSSSHSTRPPGTSRRRTSLVANLHPSSAMDIRQTRSSIAKIAEARRKMWEMQKPKLEERIMMRQSKQRQQMKCAINFSDDDLRTAHRRNAKEKFQKSRSIGAANNKSFDGSVSLDSIREEQCTPTHQHLDANLLPECLSATTPVPPPYTDNEMEVVRNLTEEERSLAQEEEHLDDMLRSERSESVIDDLVDDVEEEEEGGNGEWKDIVEDWNCTEFLTHCDWAQMTEDFYANMNNVRAPGEALNVHEKLSSPSRRKPDAKETAAKHLEKLERATAQREAIMAAKQTRIQELTVRVAEVKTRRAQIAEHLKELTMQRVTEQQAKAVEIRRTHLDAVVSRGKDDLLKVAEVAFINRLDKEGKDFDAAQRKLDDKRRLEDITEKRKRVSEARMAQKQAVEDRRKAAESDRQARVRSSAQVTQNRLARAKELKEQQLKGKQPSTRGHNLNNEIMSSSMHSDTLTDVSEELSSSLPSMSLPLILPLISHSMTTVQCGSSETTTSTTNSPVVPMSSVSFSSSSMPASPSRQPSARLRSRNEAHHHHQSRTNLGDMAKDRFAALSTIRRTDERLMKCGKCSLEFVDDSTAVAHFLLNHADEPIDQFEDSSTAHKDDAIVQLVAAGVFTWEVEGEKGKAAKTRLSSENQRKVDKLRRKFWTTKLPSDNDATTADSLKSLRSSNVRHAVEQVASSLRRVNEHMSGKNVNSFAETSCATILTLHHASADDIQIASCHIFTQSQPWTILDELLSVEAKPPHPVGQLIRLAQAVVNLTQSLNVQSFFASAQHLHMVRAMTSITTLSTNGATLDERWDDLLMDIQNVINMALGSNARLTNFDAATALGLTHSHFDLLVTPTLSTAVLISNMQICAQLLQLCVTAKSVQTRANRNGLAAGSGGWLTGVIVSSELLPHVLTRAMKVEDGKEKLALIQAAFHCFNSVAMVDLLVVQKLLCNDRFIYCALTCSKLVIDNFVHHDTTSTSNGQSCSLCTTSLFIGHILAHGSSVLIDRLMHNATVTAQLLITMSTCIIVDPAVCNLAHELSARHCIVPTVLVSLLHKEYEPTFLNCHISPKWLVDYLVEVDHDEGAPCHSWQEPHFVGYRLDTKSRSTVRRLLNNISALT